MNIHLLNQIADNVADELFSSLKAGTIEKIDIYVINAALAKAIATAAPPIDQTIFDQLSERCTRRIVNKVP